MIEDDEETIQSVKQPNFLKPELNEIKDVVRLPSELSNEQKSLEYKPAEFEFSPIPEFKPLIFTVGENFFDLEESCYERWTKEEIENVNKFIENRGLLILIEGEKNKKFSYIQLQFPTKKGFGVSKSDEENYKETSETAKTKVHLYRIESISLGKGLLKSILTIKLEPLKQYDKIHRLLVDQVEREIVLYIKRKDNKLAQQIVSAIAMRISEWELKKLLK